MNPAKAWERAKNILCVRLDALGDVLMTTPAMRALKECGIGRRLTLFTSTGAAEAASLIPEVDSVIAYDAPWMKATVLRDHAEPDWAMIERIRQHSFDAAVIFTAYSQNPLPAALFCWLAGIPLRLAHCRENPYQLLTNWEKEIEPSEIIRHEVRRQLDLVAQVGCRTNDEDMRMHVPEPSLVRVRQLLRESGMDEDWKWIVFHPGATAASRRYPPENFAVAARLLAERYGCQIVFTGTETERNLAMKIQIAMRARSHSLVGKLNLGEMAALLSIAPLLVSNNTAPVHIAASVGTPVVDLYALTNPQHTPWAVPQRVLSHNVPCKYCYKSVCPEGHNDCLRQIAPEEIVSAVLELLQETNRLVPRKEKLDVYAWN